MTTYFPVIDPVATGENIIRLRKARGLTVRQLQEWFGFEEPQAIYKWQRGKSLPSVDNLYALGKLLDVPMDSILVPYAQQKGVPQDSAARPLYFLPDSFEYGRIWKSVPIFCSVCVPSAHSVIETEQTSGLQQSIIMFFKCTPAKRGLK